MQSFGKTVSDISQVGQGPAEGDSSEPDSMLKNTIKSVYFGEIVRQVQAAKMSADLLNSALAAASADAEEQLAVVFFAAQGMLTAGALVSKILWMSQPQRPDGCRCPQLPSEKEKAMRAKRRCKELRDELGIKDQMQELSSRRVRNAFEHFDDRIDTFFADGNTWYFDRIVGPSNTVVVRNEGIDRAVKYMRRFDPEKVELSVLDDSISLQALLDALDDIGIRAQRWLDTNLPGSKVR